MSERTYGSKYDKNLNTTQIAALVRGQVKAAVKSGELPAGKYSIRTSHFAGGSSIHVKISDLKGDIFEPEYLRDGDKYLMGPSIEDESGWHRPHRFKLWVVAAVKRVEAMLADYNHDGSDIMTDYFDVKFYATVDVDYGPEELEAARAALVAADNYAGEAAMAKAEDVEAAGQALATAQALDAPRRAHLINSVAIIDAIPSARVLPFRAPAQPAESAQVRMMREMGVL